MRTLILILTLTWGSAWAESALFCRPSAALFYPNSATQVRQVELISYVSHFSLANMLAMRIDADAGPLTFTRESFSADRQVYMKFISTRMSGKFMQAWVHIDRSPREAIRTRVFRGVLFLTGLRSTRVSLPSELSPRELKTYNFECTI
ncbi:MAG: hypothetical protein ACLGG7_08070 [Bacteriovoracia bacterium]